jgi:hypothetical protein
MSQPPPDRRDELLNDVYEDPAGSSLPAQMARRIRLRRRIRTRVTTVAVLAVASIAFFHPRTRDKPQIAKSSPATSSATPHLPRSNIATDADLLAALTNESVIVFTLENGQRQVVWLRGHPPL